MELVTALDAGEDQRAAELAEDVPPGELAEMWAELTDSFGALERVGDPAPGDDGVRVPVDLIGRSFVARGTVEDGQIQRFGITLADDASTLSVLTGRLRGAVSGLLDPILDPLREVSDAGERFATASDPADRAAAAVEVLVAGRYDELTRAEFPSQVALADRGRRLVRRDRGG